MCKCVCLRFSDEVDEERRMLAAWMWPNFSTKQNDLGKTTLSCGWWASIVPSLEITLANCEQLVMIALLSSHAL